MWRRILLTKKKRRKEVIALDQMEGLSVLTLRKEEVWMPVMVRRASVMGGDHIVG